MPIFQGRSGADAIFKALHRVCIVLTHYSLKLNAAIDLVEAAGLITGEQQTAAKAFVTASGALCDIFKIIADNSGF